MSILKIEAGAQTESLLQAALADFDDTTLDTIDVEREHDLGQGLASEPITTTVVLTLAPALVLGVARAIEKWLEIKRERENLQITLKAFEVSEEAGKSLAAIAKSHAFVSISVDNRANRLQRLYRR